MNVIFWRVLQVFVRALILNILLHIKDRIRLVCWFDSQLCNVSTVWNLEQITELFISIPWQTSIFSTILQIVLILFSSIINPSFTLSYTISMSVSPTVIDHLKLSKNVNTFLTRLPFILYIESTEQIIHFASVLITLNLSGKNVIISFKSDDTGWGNDPMHRKAIPLKALTVWLEFNLFVLLSVFGNTFRTYSLNSLCDIFGCILASFASNSNVA